MKNKILVEIDRRIADQIIARDIWHEDSLMWKQVNETAQELKSLRQFIVNVK